MNVKNGVIQRKRNLYVLLGSLEEKPTINQTILQDNYNWQIKFQKQR